jgi:hypothetical protein
VAIGCHNPEDHSLNCHCGKHLRSEVLIFCSFHKTNQFQFITFPLYTTLTMEISSDLNNCACPSAQFLIADVSYVWL